MCLYDFAGVVQKTTQRRKKPDAAEDDTISRQKDASGNKSHGYGHFLLGHPQHESHTLHLRGSRLISVILGRRIARSDGGAEERQIWARTMLILFKPWRHPFYLKTPGEQWGDAFDQYRARISRYHMKIIHNMGVLAECKDARDQHVNQQGREREVIPVMDTVTDDLYSEGAYLMDEEDNTYGIFAHSDNNANKFEADRMPDPLDSAVGIDCRKVLHTCLKASNDRNSTSGTIVPGFEIDITGRDPDQLKDHTKIMNVLKRKRRPEFEETVPHEIYAQGRDRKPETAVMDIHSELLMNAQGTHSGIEPSGTVQDIISDMNMWENEEQLRAFQIVANHVQHGGHQLLMYIAGVGGTGKSHVIHAIVRLFESCGRRAELMLSAPTGIAAVLIGGYTIHALTMLPDKSRSNFAELRSLWAKVKWLVLDEVSMISAKFLSQISDRLRQAKGEDQIASHVPFGGLNIIFTGDFGQLKPVRQPAVYAHRLIKKPTFAECRDGDGVSSLNGAFLWRQVSVVVKLTKNVRQQNDHLYAEFLSRLRLGECRVGAADMEADIDMLRRRELAYIARNQPEVLPDFQDVPVIVGSRKVRDALNATLVDFHARRLNCKVMLYHSKDYIRRNEVQGAYREKLWRVSSTVTEDALGRIPIFSGMKIMITSNLAISRRIVNGAEGVVQDILYTTDDGGHRYASVVYVRVERSGSFASGLEDDIVPVLPERKSFDIQVLTASGIQKRTVSRVQLPLVPAYSYTDYKSQGRSLDRVVVDLGSARSLQGVYVMLSRVRSIHGLAILRWFPATRVYQRVSEELRDELKRVDVLHDVSAEVYTKAVSSKDYPVSMLSFSVDCAQRASGYV